MIFQAILTEAILTEAIPVEPILIQAILIGAGATAFLDIVAATRTALFGAPKTDYVLVGRWLLYLMRGRFFHAAIARSAPIAGERVTGWSAHYLIGIAFAAMLLVLFPDWARTPTFIPAMVVGIGSVAAPFLLMQPGMGSGLAARRAPDPSAARRRSITTHTIFGIGLYAAGWATNLLEF